jgi:excinuclease UvrABC ATPase subunit
MGDFSQTCEVCHGKRYKQEVLDATIDGYSIADVLDLTGISPPDKVDKGCPSDI